MKENDKLIVLKFLENLLNDYKLRIIIDNSKEESKEKIFKMTNLENHPIGSIANEEFDNLATIVNRLNIYHEIYIYDTLKERIEDKEVIPKDDLDYIAKRFIESDLISKVLQEITPKNYNEMVKKLDEVNVKDIKCIIQAEDEMYKNICMKYIKTFSNEMLLENNDEILHFLISDNYIYLKDMGKINIENYKEYLDDYDCVYRYSSYKELFDYEIKMEICKDMEEVGIFDELNEWNFYLTFEELKQIGLEDKVKEEYLLNGDVEEEFEV